MKTLTPCVMYLMQSNTDVTSLLLGTAVKAIMACVSDYITKQSLKTHQIFSSAYDIFETVKPVEGARKLLLKVVNCLSMKIELGSLMAAMYLLEHPDHYTSHKFVTFWWKGFVYQVHRVWDTTTGNDNIAKHKSDENDQNNYEIDIDVTNTQTNADRLEINSLNDLSQETNDNMDVDNEQVINDHMFKGGGHYNAVGKKSINTIKGNVLQKEKSQFDCQNEDLEQEDNECDNWAIQNDTKDIIFDERIYALKKLYEDGTNFCPTKDKEQIKNEEPLCC